MNRVTHARPNARETAVGIAINVGIALAAAAAVFLFDLHEAVVAFGIILGPSLGLLQARRMASRRTSRATALGTTGSTTTR